MRVIVGRVGRPHGIRGEVVIGVRTDEPDLRFAMGATLDAHRDLPDAPSGPPDASPQWGPGRSPDGPPERGPEGSPDASPQWGPGGSPADPPKGGPGGSGGTASPPRSRGGLGGIVPPGQHRLTVASARWHSGQLLVAFAGITDRTAAGELTGSWLSVDSSQLPAIPDPDEFRDHELIGLSVRTAAGDPVGVVADVLHHGQDLLVVRRGDGQDSECLVPFVKAIVPEVDVPGGVLVIDPPPGLLDPAQAQ